MKRTIGSMARDIQTFRFGVPTEDAYGYAQAVRVNETVYISGQFAHDERGELVGAFDLSRQLAQTLDNLDKVLSSCGATRAHVVQTTVYAVGLQKHLATLAQAHLDYFGEHPPSSTALGVAELIYPGQLVELGATVRLDRRPI